MSSDQPGYYDEDDTYDEDDSPTEDDFTDVLLCGECHREFEVGFGEDPESCPLCGAQFD